MWAAAAAWDDVVDVLGGATAVLAGAPVAKEDAAAAEGCAASVRDVDVTAEPYDRWRR
jgi:hypothetical protein